MEYKKRRYKPFFGNKTCDICKSPAVMFRLIKDKTYMLCESKKCDFFTRVKNNWHETIIGK